MRTLQLSGGVLVALGLLAVSASAQDVAPPAPPIAPASSSRPVLPKVFDRAMVEDLLANIDAPRNASTLKVGYFLRRGGGADALPVSEGFALLKAAAEKEPVGTRRWFMLQSLRGFAAFRTPGVSSDEGSEAYNAIFEHAKDAEKGNAVYPLRQAIAEFVGLVTGRFNDLGLTHAVRTQDTLVAAWNANLLALAMSMPGQSQPPEPEWNAAIEAAGVKETFAPLVEKSLAALKSPDANERQIIQTATVLLAWQGDAKAPDAKAGEQGAQLLRNYLAANRSRDVENELQARLLLGNYLMKQNKTVDAKSVLTVPQDLKMQSQRAQNLLRSIEKVRQQLS